MKCDLFVPQHRDVFHKQPDHSFSITILSGWISPEPWKILRQGQDRGSLLFVENLTVLFLPLFVFLLSFIQRTQLLIPVGFESIGNQSILRVDMHISTLRQFRFIPGPLDLLFAKSIDFIQPCLQLLLHGQSDIECDRVHHFQQYVTNHAIDLGARYTLTKRLGILDPFALANVFRAQASLAQVLAQRHAPATLATNNQALQQSRAFSRRTVTAISTKGLRVFS